MPGFDGTGPRGFGPMTGEGRGYCVLKVSNTPREPITGFAGLPGRPVKFFTARQIGVRWAYPLCRPVSYGCKWYWRPSDDIWTS